ncbi:MAG: 2'-5' RNA ligase family protein [Proteobacteria bacterium]|nr:2'-5' RNA ligase family protein [Pseudomonadota bacterium]
MIRLRHQLSLFLPAAHALTPRIEAVRRVVDPVQHHLIAAHVTLCRDEDGLDLHAVAERLGRHPPAALRLGFGPAQVFQGHGLLLPCVRGGEAFAALRRQALAETGVRAQQPHLTLAHPRNPLAPGNRRAATTALPQTFDIDLDQLHLIRQQGDAPWTVLRTIRLSGAPRP